jgi:hypothetical protein
VQHYRRYSNMSSASIVFILKDGAGTSTCRRRATATPARSRRWPDRPARGSGSPVRARRLTPAGEALRTDVRLRPPCWPRADQSERARADAGGPGLQFSLARRDDGLTASQRAARARRFFCSFLRAARLRAVLHGHGGLLRLEGSGAAGVPCMVRLTLTPRGGVTEQSGTLSQAPILAPGVGMAAVARGTTMEFGFGLPTRGPMATSHSLATLAHKGEELGVAIISVSDHIIIPREIASTYPYNQSGSFAGDPSGACMEQLTLLSFLVGVTSTAKLLTSVMVLPHRPPVLTAEMLATNRRALQWAPHRRLRCELDARGVRGDWRAGHTTSAVPSVPKSILPDRTNRLECAGCADGSRLERGRPRPSLLPVILSRLLDLLHGRPAAIPSCGRCFPTLRALVLWHGPSPPLGGRCSQFVLMMSTWLPRDSPLVRSGSCPLLRDYGRTTRVAPRDSRSPTATITRTPFVLQRPPTPRHRPVPKRRRWEAGARAVPCRPRR